MFFASDLWFTRGIRTEGVFKRARWPPLLFLTAVKDCILSVSQELKSEGCEGLFPFPLE